MSSAPANRAFRLIHSRGRPAPALAAPDRQDIIEVVDVADGEVSLFWVLPARQASRLARTLRTELATLDADAFARRWRDADHSYGDPDGDE